MVWRRAARLLAALVITTRATQTTNMIYSAVERPEVYYSNNTTHDLMDGIDEKTFPMMH